MGFSVALTDFGQCLWFGVFSRFRLCFSQFYRRCPWFGPFSRFSQKAEPEPERLHRKVEGPDRLLKFGLGFQKPKPRVQRIKLDNFRLAMQRKAEFGNDFLLS
jgi:hypothetical protein